MKRLALTLVTLVTLLAAGCNAQAEGLQHLSVAETQTKLQSATPPLLIDVREPHEFAAGHAPGALNVPLGQVSRWAEGQDKDRPTLIICQTGRRSVTAGNTLLGLGFQDVTNVLGGTADWIHQGLPVER